MGIAAEFGILGWSFWGEFDVLLQDSENRVNYASPIDTVTER